MPIKHIGFDLDGTLLDTQEQIVESILGCLGPKQRTTAKRMVIESSDKSPKAILRQFGIANLNEFWRHHADCARLARPFFANTPQLLGQLRNMGFTLSIITSLPARPAKALLNKAGIADQFSLIDTFASRSYRKPSPRLLELHLNEIGVLPREAVYVGDSEGDMRMTNAAGATALGVGWSRSTPDALIRAGAQRILDSLEQLADASWMAGIFASPIPRPC
jgi:HAD superfamily hydrolase (TIGR01549 family)